jgi:hypothetical protein
MHRNREEREKCERRWPLAEAGEGNGAPADFDGDKLFPELGGRSNKGGKVEEDCPGTVARTSGCGERDLEEGTGGLN